MFKRAPFQASDKVGLAAWLLPELLAAGARRNLAEHELLQGSRVFAADLQFSQTRLSYRDWWHICANASKGAGAELAWISGQALYFQQHPFARLLKSAPNKRLALRWLSKLRRQYFPFIYPTLKRSPSEWKLSLQALPGQTLDASHRFSIEMALAFCQQVLDDPNVKLIGRSEIGRYAQGEFVGSANSYGLCWSDSVLEQVCATSMHAEYVHQIRICQQQALLLEATTSAPEQVYRLLARSLPELPTLEHCASNLCLSSSGLKRQLAEFNCNFSKLQDKVREDKAVTLLHKDQSNRQLAQALGFSDEHNFRRAFKRWTGLLPSAFRL